MQSKLAILIVDDSEIILDRLGSLLSELKNVEKIYLADSQEKARKILEEKVIHVLVLDINIGSENGIDLLRYIKERQYRLRMVIMMTTDVKEYEKALCEILGADHFISKFEGFELIEKLIADLS